MSMWSFAVLALVATAVSASAQTQSVDPPTVVVRGEGIVRVAPDRAMVRIGAESRDKAPRAAQAANAEAMTAVQQRLAASGIAREAVRTVGVSLQQEFDYRDGKQVSRGYVARNTIEVRVDDLSHLGEVMDAVVQSGATSIQGLQFDVKDRASLEREALTQAVAAATARAEAAAAGAKRTIERVLRIEEAFVDGPMRPQPAAMFRMASEQDAASTPVAEGEIEIRAVVSVTAVLK